MKKFDIIYRADGDTHTVEAEGFKKAQDQVASIMDAGFDIIDIREHVKICEVIDYTLKRKGDRGYFLIDGDGNIVNAGGSWKTKKACEVQAKAIHTKVIGIETVHQNYSHWADFHPVKEGVMADG